MTPKNILLTTLLMSIACGLCVGAPYDCSRWFWGCKYKCHCEDNLLCDYITGHCPGSCEQGWFGPSCQYESLNFSASGLVDNWLADDDDSTCNDGSVRSITVSLDTPQPLTWIRVMVNDPDKLGEFQLSYTMNDQVTECPDVQTAKVDNVTLDMHCPTPDVVTDMLLSGAGVGAVCTLHISGGRNVALKESASQTSGKIEWWPSNAVDGHAGEPYSFEHQFEAVCSRMEGSGVLTWTLTFLEPAYITKIIIYGWRESFGGYAERFLQGFTLDVFNASDGKVYTNTNSSSSGLGIYTLVPSPKIQEPVKKISIHRSGEISDLVICEVAVSGEKACPPGRFGLNCEKFCACADQEDCFTSTGGCPTGCAPGFTGADCSMAIHPITSEGDDESSKTTELTIGLIVVAVAAVVALLVAAIALFLARRAYASG